MKSILKTKNTAFKGLILLLLIMLCIGAVSAAEDTISDDCNLNDASLSVDDGTVSDYQW